MTADAEDSEQTPGNLSVIRSLKRFLARPAPRGAKQLRMTAVAADSAQSVTLNEWASADAKPELAMEIAESLADHAEEMRATVHARIFFVTGEGEAEKQLGREKLIKFTPDSLRVEGEDYTMAPAQLTGDHQSQAAQAQHHLQSMLAMFLGAQASMFRQMMTNNQHTMELNEMLATRLSESDRREREAKQETEEVKEQLAEVQAETGDEEKTTETQKQIMTMLTPVVQAMMMKAVAGSGGGGTSGGGG